MLEFSDFWINTTFTDGYRCIISVKFLASENFFDDSLRKKIQFSVSLILSLL